MSNQQSNISISIEYSSPTTNLPSYISNAINGGLTSYFILKGVADALNDHARLPVFGQYRAAQDAINPFFVNDASLVTHAPTSTEINDAKVLEALLTPAVKSYASTNHLSFAQAAADVGSAIDTLVAYNRYDGDYVRGLGQFEGLLAGNGYDLEDLGPASHYASIYTNTLPTTGQSVTLIGAIFQTADQIQNGLLSIHGGPF